MTLTPVHRLTYYMTQNFKLNNLVPFPLTSDQNWGFQSRLKRPMSLGKMLTYLDVPVMSQVTEKGRTGVFEIVLMRAIE